MRSWRHLYRLFRLNWTLAALAFGAVIITRLALWSVPYRHVHRFFASFPPQGPEPATSTRGRRRRIASAVSIVSPFVPKASCLTQALATRILLRIKGENARLHLGATRDESGRFKAHAWLESNGELLIGNLPDLAQYRPLRQTAEERSPT